MENEMMMHVEVSGCPTVCQHCWVLGRNYQAMPMEDVSWVLQEVRRFCSAHDFSIEGWPMHEVTAHPQAAQVIKLFHDHWNTNFSPIVTTGVFLATSPGWREFLDALPTLGSRTLWFAFHGADEIHDHAVMHAGAYQKSLRAIERTREVGMRAGCNLFLTKENVHQFDQLIADLQRAGIQEIDMSLYNFTANARGRHTEALRPEWQDVQPLIEKLDMIPETQLWHRFWQEVPHKYTEGWFVKQALQGTWPAESEYRALYLVCRPNLDVYRGVSGQYNKRYGNLRNDGVDEVLGRAIADGAYPRDEIWFTKEQLRPVRELAVRYGNGKSQRIHSSPASLRHWWQDCARHTASIL